jgi:ferredoxin--NADP+ reductase
MITETITWVHHWSDRTFSFRTTRSQGFKFNAGEFAMIGLMIDGRKVLRAYSVASPPWAEYLEFLSIKIADGQLTSKLQNIKVGDEVILMEKPTGTLRNDALVNTGELWLLATGTGLAPFMSLIKDIETLDTWNRINIVHSVRDRKDLAYYTELSTNFADSEPDLTEMIAKVLNYIPLVTGEGDKRITEQLDSDLTINTTTDKIMVCGNLEFNRQVAEWCESTGMVEGSLRDPADYVVERAFVEK